MKVTVASVSDPAIGKLWTVPYITVGLITESGGFARVFLVPSFRNSPNWKDPIPDHSQWFPITEGQTYEGARFLGQSDSLIDGDSPVRPAPGPPCVYISKKKPKRPPAQGELFAL